MNILFTILTILVLIASVLITMIVLLQNGKGGGLASNFVTGNQTFGVRQTTDILEKITWGLVAFIFLVSIITAITPGTTVAEVENTVENVVEQESPDFSNDFSLGGEASDAAVADTTAE